MRPEAGARRRGSIVWRVAAASLLIAGLAVTLLFAASWSTLRRGTSEALAATVTTDIAGLIDIHASGGERELLRRVADRKDVVTMEGRRPHYLVARADGTPLAGDIRAWPPLSAALSEQGYVTLAGGTPVYARAAKLGPDLQLLVAREYAQDRETMRRLTHIFLAVGAAIVLGVGAVAMLTARGLARRIDHVNANLRAAAEGYPAALESPGTPRDEIDELALQGARLLARQARLVRVQKHVSDHVAHEIRTPLMHLDARLAAALQERSEPGGSGTLTRSRADIRTIVTMLDSLLDIASNEGRRGDLAGLSELDLSALLTDVAALYEGSVEEAGLALETAIEPGVTMLAERMQIVRLVSNLLDNAIKYVPAGGTVCLALTHGPRIIIADDGPGIPPEDRARIFERFARSAGQVTQPGHGLGLALARAIAQRHGLVLRLDETARGACFVVEPET
ncbi:two-component system sensor histidine kinase [Sphingobium sp. SYK-6]|uniref:sensor histidine kinase n=1 Tax=Sphingobium sp. (strain NBRC 103272 / SYK-6) TaxID=627192 RepID=UPI0002276C43|nr:HAMP domain-containing sensor histidine kinase [Sphingobium sp. SYK-6]BAK64898.1 two-component system sensor histidine kinase [Sphingobium sp. SYK-6]